MVKTPTVTTSHTMWMTWYLDLTQRNHYHKVTAWHLWALFVIQDDDVDTPLTSSLGRLDLIVNYHIVALSNSSSQKKCAHITDLDETQVNDMFFISSQKENGAFDGLDFVACTRALDNFTSSGSFCNLLPPNWWQEKTFFLNENWSI